MTREPIYAKHIEVSVVDVEENADEDIKSGAKVSKIYKYIDDMEIDIEEEQI